MQIQDNGKVTHSQKAPIPRPVLTFADTDGTLRAYCPACGEFALEIDEANKPIVKCSHCGFQSPLSRFKVQHRDAMHTPVADYPLQSLSTPQAHNGTPQAQRPKLLATKPLSAWLNEAKAQPPITPLFDVFWLRGELAFMFGATNVGKTILAVQILDALSKGAKVQSFDGAQTPMRVCYFDFELSARQFFQRYSDEKGNIHQFSEFFLRAEIDPNAPLPKGMNFQDFILEEIERTVIEHQIQVVAIDNLTALISNITETKDALELMHRLRLIKIRHNLSMLVLSHSPKRDPNRPITKNDMVGSMHLLNLCDSAFCIGQSAKENDIRYAKQVKSRSAEFKYDAENVAVFRLVKHDRFIGFGHIGFDDEKEHLRARTDAEMDALDREIISLHQREPNLSYREIAGQLGTNHTRVRRAIEKAKGSLLQSPEPF